MNTNHAPARHAAALLSCCALMAFLFASCVFEVVAPETTPEADLPDTEYMVTLNGESSVTLTGVQGKTLLYANFNTSGSSAASPRYLVSRSGIADGSVSPLVPSSSVSSRSAVEQEPPVQDSLGIIRHFTPPETFSFSAASTAGARTLVSAPSRNEVTHEQFAIGVTKQFYADSDVGLKTYKEKKFTLAAKGFDGGGTAVCLVWVDSSLYSENGQGCGETVNQTMAKNLADTFATYYAKEKAVFGDECEYLFDSNGRRLSQTMGYTSDTGSLVNIVIYDIGNDYTASNDNYKNSQTEECGVVGYFYAKDYFEKNSSYSADTQYSNAGKFFYIDAAFCNLSGNDGTSYLYGGVSGNKVSDTVVSTLFHEFQHMLDFAQKDVNGVSSPQWYNEMLSMLAEDMMQDSLGLSNAEAPKGSRLPAFNQYYRYSGIDEYRNDKYAVISYSTAYSFGAWLSRTYGGPEFVGRMSKNRYGGMDSVRAAIQETTGESLSNLQIFKLYLQACAFRPSFASSASHSLPTHYRDAGGALQGFSMSKINLFGSDYGFTPDKSSTRYYGPALFRYDVQTAVRPHGFVLHSIGTATQDTVTLQFSARASASEQVVIFIQDGFRNTEADLLSE